MKRILFLQSVRREAALRPSSRTPPRADLARGGAAKGAVFKSVLLFLLPILIFLSAAFLPAAAGPPPAPPAIQKLFDEGSYRSAVTSLDAATAANPSNAVLHYWLGRSFYELRDFSHAISSFESAVAIDPQRSEYHDWLGRASGHKAEESQFLARLAAIGLARRAEREFSAAVRLDPRNVNAQRDLIRYLLMAPSFAGGSEDRAEKQIQDLATADPLEGQLASAELLAIHKKFDEAGAKYQEILAGKPRSLIAYLEIAEYYRQHGDAQHIQRTVNAAAAQGLTDSRLLYYSGVASILLRQDPATAEQDLRQYLAAVPDNSADPSHASADDWLGQLYANQGKLDAAVAAYRAELDLDPRNKAVRDTLSRLEKQR